MKNRSKQVESSFESLKMQINKWNGLKGKQDERQEWIREGIDLYEKLIRHKQADFDKEKNHRELAKLYLEYGRSEKMIGGNVQTALAHLKKAAVLSYEKGDSFYHLAFLAEKQVRGNNWETVAFYVKEAMERGLDTDKEIKAWCLLGKAYNYLGLKRDAAECFNESKKLDPDDGHAHFRTNYSRSRMEKDAHINILNGLDPKPRSTDRDTKKEEVLASGGYIIIISLSRIGLKGGGVVMPLTIRESDLLKALFDSRRPLDSGDILRLLPEAGSKNKNSIKTDIFRLRRKMSEYFETEGSEIIETVERSKYRWNPGIQKYLDDQTQ